MRLDVGAVDGAEDGDRACDEHGAQPDEHHLGQNQLLAAAVVARLQRVADAQVSADGDERHVQDGRRAAQDVEGDVHVAQRRAERPFSSCNKTRAIRLMSGLMFGLPEIGLQTNVVV